MKLTKEKLKQIIREELGAVLEVSSYPSSGKGSSSSRRRKEANLRADARAAALRSLARQHRELEKPEKSEGWVLRRSGVEEKEGKYYIGGDDYGSRDQARVFEFEKQAEYYADEIYKEEGYHLVPEEA